MSARRRGLKPQNVESGFNPTAGIELTSIYKRPTEAEIAANSQLAGMALASRCLGSILRFQGTVHVSRRCLWPGRRHRRNRWGPYRDLRYDLLTDRIFAVTLALGRSKGHVVPKVWVIAKSHLRRFWESRKADSKVAQSVCSLGSSWLIVPSGPTSERSNKPLDRPTKLAIASSLTRATTASD